ncbi:MAG: alcohol dehydrogenase [Mucilaginibacter sp.]|nr:alcohol dehydrogenase [Mucilaginibacter sp.]
MNGFGDVSNFSLTHLDDPIVKNDEVLIQIKAAAFNPIDYQMRLGLRESRLMRSPVLGRELSGVIVKAGPDVTGFEPGDEVMALAGSRGSNGSYAELIALDYRMLGWKPHHISFEEAAAIPSSGLTAWHSFTRMQMRSSDSIFINGAAGGVGRFLIKLLKANGVSNITATAGSEQSIAALQNLGLNSGQIVNYNQPDLRDLLITSNNGNRFDYAVDLVGGTIAETTADVLKMNGSYVDITFLGTSITREILFDNGANILNIAAYAFAVENNLTWYGDTLNHLAQLIDAGKIDAPAVKVIGGLSVETVQEAHRLMEANRIYGKKLVMSV